MDWNLEIKSAIAWADSYEDADGFEDERHEKDEDKTVQDLTAAHELWMALLKSWTKTKPWYPPNPDRG
jgi:hypothetical protein